MFGCEFCLLIYFTIMKLRVCVCEKPFDPIKPLHM